MDRHADQLPAWRAQFDAFDVDKSGQISEAEFCKVLRGIGQVVRDDEATALFKSFDHDRDNHISFEEFMSLVLSMDTRTGEIRPATDASKATATEISSVLQVQGSWEAAPEGVPPPIRQQHVHLPGTLLKCISLTKAVENNACIAAGGYSKTSRRAYQQRCSPGDIVTVVDDPPMTAAQSNVLQQEGSVAVTLSGAPDGMIFRVLLSSAADVRRRDELLQLQVLPEHERPHKLFTRFVVLPVAPDGQLTVEIV
eukprot:COSAG02_NODE_9098_length_2332_cov_1.397223_1_plen_252_part_10